VKNFILDALSSERFLGVTAPLLHAHGIIFFGHRFADVERGSPGHDPEVLRADLELLRRNKFNIAPLMEVVHRLEEGVPLLPRTVVFTIDDGYADFTRVAAPIFAAFDCPVTVFVTTGFLDRDIWMWWDQIAFLLLHSERRSVDLRTDAVTIREQWATAQEREAAATHMSVSLSLIPDSEKWRVIEALAELLDVNVPARAPEEFLPMSWEEVRACERRGVTFGPHTVTHPVLSRVSDDRAIAEIGDSWTRLRAEVEAPVPVFCYPDGSESAYSDREVVNTREAGLRAAVTTLAGYVESADYRGQPSVRLFNIPRLSYPEPGNESTFAHMISGLERGKIWARQFRAAHRATSRARRGW
jgi:peptidoglycan/xylan/chitin deacetylase (PgdA/CDA1 family)